MPTADHNRYYADHRQEYGHGDENARELEAFVQAGMSPGEALRKATPARGALICDFWGSSRCATGPDTGERCQKRRDGLSARRCYTGVELS